LHAERPQLTGETASGEPVRYRWFTGIVHDARTMPIIAIDGVRNARRIGRRFGLRYVRSANLDRITPRGIEDLSLHGITRVIDLRDDSERHALGEAPTSYGAVPVLHMPIYHSPAGPPMIGRLENVYDGILESRAPEIARVVEAIIDGDGFTLVHCASGKDRTGVVSAVLSLAAGATDEDVVADYVKSSDQLGTERHRIVKAMVDMLPITAADRRDALRLQLDSPAAAIEHVIATIERFGGPHAYLRRGGISEDTLRTIAERAAEAARFRAA
jgi:protein-tyrosine phosphatase